ncbi:MULTISPECIES: sigma factor-like helix-turn-helix DNA-binding protein [Caulobacter]|uniref:sigma factor-like helix-turn-helix DNA-binding protein n=1 Tax=Caulobacter TaxID=75 RepID=UPI0003A4D520|nr:MULTISPECIES: sigma factor-like helix-turn-helix DNA-binding protein [Caulobacter]
MLAYLARREEMRRFFRARTGGREDVETLMRRLLDKARQADGEAIEDPSVRLYRLASSLLRDRPRAAAGDPSWVRTLDTLPPMTRQVFRLHRFEGLTQTEIADRLGLSRRAVEILIGQAITRLLRARQQQDGEAT